MPESLSLLEEMTSLCTTPSSIDSPTNLNVSYEIVKSRYADHDLSRSDRTMSVESLNTILSKLPEISIPPTVCNPLPLQCIAANALPENVKAEIDCVIAQYTTHATNAVPARNNDDDHAHSSTSTTSLPDTEEDKDVDTLTAALHRALGIEEVATTTSSSGPVPVIPVSKKIIQREVEEETSTGFGMKLCGGVKCTNCCSLHAVVTGMSASLYEADDIMEGMCVVEWGGQTLDGCTYEEAQRIVDSTEAGVDEIEISVKKCSENVLTSQGGFNGLPSFAAVRLNKRRNAIFETKRNSDCKSTGSEDSSVPSPPSYSMSQSRDQLSLLFSDSLQSSARSLSRSLSPIEASKFLVSKSEETFSPAQSAAAMAIASESLGFDNLDSFVKTQPKGVIQLCLDYNKEFEELNVSLLQVKGYSSKEAGDSCDVFINTYLIPDHRDQGVRNIVISQTRKDGSELHNTSYMLPADEVPCTALRVILWDAHKQKHIEFRGEVFLGLSDQQFVNLACEPTWYTLCPEDPNLSKLPPPIYSKAKNGVDYLFQKLKQKAHSLTSKPILKLSSSLSTELRSESMLSLPGQVEKHTMTLSRKKKRKESRKTYSGSFIRSLEDDTKQPEGVQLKSCLKESCRQKKISSILNVLKEELVDSGSTSRTKVRHGQSFIEYTEGTAEREHLTTLDRRLRHKPAASISSEKQTRKRSGVRENENSFFEELEKMMDQEKFGLQSAFDNPQKEKLHYKLVDSCQSEDELDKPTTKSSPSRHSKVDDFSSYTAEVSLHKISVEDVDRKKEAKKKSCTLPNEHSSQKKPQVFLPVRGGSDKRPLKPPKTSRSKSVGDIEKLGSEEEVFIVRSRHAANSVPMETSGYNTTDKFVSLEPTAFDEETDRESSLDFGNRYDYNTTDKFVSLEPTAFDEKIDGESSLDFGNRWDYLNSVRGTSVPIAEHNGHQSGKKLLKTKWKSLEDILAPKPRKSKEKKAKQLQTNSPAGVDTRTHTFFRRSSVQENGTSTSSCDVKLECHFNDLNPTHPVLLVKLLDITLPSSKLLSSDLLLKCYVNHVSTGVCILKDKTSVSVKNNPSSAPLGILQFATDIANLSLQLYGGSKMFSRKIIGQVSVDLANLNVSDDKTHSQWYTLTKPEL